MGDGNRLYMCGTNAHAPKDWVIYVSSHVPRARTNEGINYRPLLLFVRCSENRNDHWIIFVRADPNRSLIFALPFDARE